MRVTRSRSAASKRKAPDFVELDSEEFEEALEGGVPPSSKRSKTTATPSRTDDSAGHLFCTKQASRSGAEPESSCEDEDNEVDEASEELEEVSNGTGDAQGNLDSEADPPLSDSCSEDQANTSSEDAGISKRKQQRGKPKQAKKPRKKRLSTRRLCATYAKAQFHLTDRDLAELTDVEYRENPYYPLGPMMKLYLVRELQELAQKKHAEKARLAATAEERALERAAAARAKRVAAAEAAAEALKAMGTQSCKPADDKYGTFKLPETCLSRIMEMIADSLEPGGLKGPSAVAAELGQAALVCWDFYHASKAGFAALAEATTSTLQQVLSPYSYLTHAKESTSHRLAQDRQLLAIYELPGPEDSGVTWSFWDDVIKDPTALKLPQLKDAARLLALPVTGTKAELVVRILDVFGLKAPTAAPAKLIRTLLLERSRRTQFWDGPDGACQLQAALDKLRSARHPMTNGVCFWQSVAAVRKHLLAHFSSLSDMKAVADTALAEHNRKVAEENARLAKKHAEQQAKLAQRRAAQLAANQAMRAAGISPAAPGGNCSCGNPAAKACPRGCCGNCCRNFSNLPGAVPCQRHRC